MGFFAYLDEKLRALIIDFQNNSLQTYSLSMDEHDVLFKSYLCPLALDSDVSENVKNHGSAMDIFYVTSWWTNQILKNLFLVVPIALTWHDPSKHNLSNLIGLIPCVTVQFFNTHCLLKYANEIKGPPLEPQVFLSISRKLSVYHFSWW